MINRYIDSQIMADRARAESAARLVQQGAGRITLADTEELEIQNGSITVEKSFHVVDTEDQSPADVISTITTEHHNHLLYLSQQDAARTITLEHNTGNILTLQGTNIVLDSPLKVAVMLYRNDVWRIINESTLRL